MLLTHTEFLDSGIRVSNDISEDEIKFAINTIENFYVKNAVTDTHFIDLNTNPTDPTNQILLKGGVLNGVIYAGIKIAECHLVYAYLMSENIRVTRYSSVEKNSEYSKNSNREDILEQARVHWNIGLSFVEEVMKYYNLNTSHNNGNNLFETIVF